ncbi:hypothetical protein SRABI83_00896 [Arthrobacter sp. Bi83]|nr:hypothetical protein SRABI83_00896 [Arthrobacter sp. Bi83]
MMTQENHVQVNMQSLKISDGTQISIPEEGVVLFVGPNNSGKSQSLRDIYHLNNEAGYLGRAVVDLVLNKVGTGPSFAGWIANNTPVIRTADGQERWNIGDYGNVTADQHPQLWNNDRLNHFARLFIFHADATSRLEAGKSVPNINFNSDVITEPLQHAYKDPELEAQLRDAAVSAFDLSLSVDRFAGSVISLRVGDAPEFEHQGSAPSSRYLQGMAALPLLEDQGDGMKSYMGLLLHILAGNHQITLVDEPEAFLHPPQARLLGQTLARRAQTGQQLFLATHSNDIVQGVLDSDAPVTIVRFTREGDINNAAVLEPSEVRTLWSDPLLRYSNLLEGLFHDAVILCEGDADCRFYSSVIDSIYEQGEAIDEGRRPQLLFSHCGGKARISSVVSSLRAISIPVVVVADFDILNNETLLEKTVVALGGDFESMRRNWRVFNAALSSDDKPVSKIAIKESLNDAIDGISSVNVNRSDARKISQLLKIENGWDKVKKVGISGVPSGDAYIAAEALLADLEKTGLLVVPVGELERFIPTVSGHGPGWVTEVHRQGLHADPRLTPQRDFAKAILSSARQARNVPTTMVASDSVPVEG